VTQQIVFCSATTRSPRFNCTCESKAPMTPQWENNIPEILRALPARISDVLATWAERSPDHPALVEAAGTWTYRELAAVVAETQSWLINSGVRAGDRVLIVCENCRAFAALLLAAAAMDAWPVLVNAKLSGGEVDAIREHSGARRVIYTSSISSHATEHAKRHNALIGEAAGLGQIGLGALNESAVPEPVDPDPARRIAALIYTSGTTGIPKGVMLTHRNVLFIAAVSAKIRSLTPEDRLYGILPMSHAVGLSVVLLGTLLSGATVYISPRFDPIAARSAIEKDRVTVVLGVPAMFGQFIEYAKMRKLESVKFPSLRIISSSGAPLDPAIKSATEKLFGLVLHNGFGITECSPTIAQTRIESPRTDISVGRALPGVELKLVGRDQQPVPDGEIGELWVRGPNIMKGYYRAPEETAAAINGEDWFNARDLARLKDGNLFIVGRTKELIVRSGFNVYPLDVEAVLNAHPAVVQSAVIGRSVPGDEQVLAFVQLLPGSAVTVGELAAHAAKHLALYKRPSEIFLVTTMPVTPTGKIVKAELSKMVAQISEARSQRRNASL
jgi:long-chain acyl-CoA synthetase